MKDITKIPILLAGRRVEPDGDFYEFDFEDSRVLLAKPSLKEIQDVATIDIGKELRELSIDDITAFFDRVRIDWSDPDNKWRQMAIREGARCNGYSTAMVEWDANFLANSLVRAKQYDTLETDLGDPTLLDDWNRVKATLLRCWPVGLISHIMVGNVPMASLFTLWRSLVTKNITVAKVPKRDPISALCFANCMADIGEEHPVVKALSVLYWEPECSIEDFLLNASNVVSVWGRGQSVASIKRRIPVGTDLIEFGPKRSFALIMDGVTDWDMVGMRVAYAVIMYDQEGCFSPQDVFVIGDAQPLAEAVTVWLAKAAKAIPRRALDADGEAHISRARIEAMTDGHEVLEPSGSEWTVIVIDGPEIVDEHPLSRTLYVHSISKLGDVLATIDPLVHTVSVEPWSHVMEVADALTQAGADRIVRAGHMGRMRPGFVHDGFHPMRRMVRWTTIEKGFEQKYRFANYTSEQDEARMKALLGDGL